MPAPNPHASLANARLSILRVDESEDERLAVTEGTETVAAGVPALVSRMSAEEAVTYGREGETKLYKVSFFAPSPVPDAADLLVGTIEGESRTLNVLDDAADRVDLWVCAAREVE